MTNNGNILVHKLDEFIRRYYKNRLLKGSIYSSGILIAAFFTVVFLEYFGEFNSTIRGLLFFGFLGSSLFVLSRYILIPLLKLYRIGEVISYDQAATIIGNHFTAVQDKLLNVLQLQNYQLLSGSDELLLAGINQKISELQTVPFGTAIDLGENKKQLRYLIPLLLLGSTIVIVWPHILSKSTSRLVNYQTYYEKDVPFHFTILNPALKALQAQDYKLQVKITGTEIPDEVFIRLGDIEYKLEKDNNILFSHTFTNLQSNTNFQLSATGFLSKEYVIEVLPKPSLLQFSLKLIYPTYLNKPSETINNTGDLQIPQGTRVNWVFHTRNTERLNLRFADSIVSPERSNEDEFRFSRRFLNSNDYTIKASNKFVAQAPDSVNYVIQVIPDQFPVIVATEEKDSLNPKNIYFSGQIRDDYGFSGLTFNFKKFGTDSNGRSFEMKGNSAIGIGKTQVSQPYFHFLDASLYGLNPGDRIEYYFEVFDNDGVKGPKSSRTQLMTFKAPTKEEISENTQRNNSEIKKDLEESIKKAKQLQKDVNELSKKINDKKQLGYEEKKKIEELLKKQQELQNRVEEVKKENEQNNKQQNEFNQTDESILEKQQQLQQLFENVMTPEMKKLFEELSKMLEMMDKKEIQEKLDEMKLSNKDIEKELERNLEAFKQLEVAQKMQDAIEKLDELQKKEEQLKQETEGKKKEEKTGDNTKKDEVDKSAKKEKGAAEDPKKRMEEPQDNKKEEFRQTENGEKKADAKDLEKKQDDIRKEFEKLSEDLKEIEKKNAELEEPNKLPSTDEKQNEINKEMQKSSQQLKQNNKKGASQSQKSAAEKMEEMKEQMESAMEEEEEKQGEENAQALRQVLENLVNLSFGQEELIKALPTIRIDNPQFVAIPKQQNKLKDDSKIIEDSLLALSKRAPQISAIVNREISAINLNMDKTVKALAERNTGESAMRMQTTMTSVNNLALLLNEALEQMQEQMKNQNQSKSQKAGKCKKPGMGAGQNPSKKGNSVASMRKLQEQLNKQLQDLKEAMEKGQKPGEKPGDKKGQKPGSGMGQNGQNGSSLPGNSEQLAKMAAQQEALRRQMQAMMEKLKNKGKNPGGDIASLMEETEKDLVNKQISTATLKRQQDILSRLLESEKAEREREQDEQRKSNEAKNQDFSNPSEFLEYKRTKEKEMELLNTVPPSLTPYYKEKVDKYFNSLNK